MRNLGLISGIVSVAGVFVAFIPCLGWFNWLMVPFAIFGAVINIVALSSTDKPDKTNAIIGLVCCVFAVLFGIARLFAGGGLI